jgi:hypothetical protein
LHTGAFPSKHASGTPWALGCKGWEFFSFQSSIQGYSMLFFISLRKKKPANSFAKRSLEESGAKKLL